MAASFGLFLANFRFSGALFSRMRDFFNLSFKCPKPYLVQAAYSLKFPQTYMFNILDPIVFNYSERLWIFCGVITML